MLAIIPQVVKALKEKLYDRRIIGGLRMECADYSSTARHYRQQRDGRVFSRCL